MVAFASTLADPPFGAWETWDSPWRTGRFDLVDEPSGRPLGDPADSAQLVASDDPFDDFDEDDFDDEFDDDFEEDWEDDLTEDDEFPDTFGGEEKKKDAGSDDGKTGGKGGKSKFSDDPDFDEG